MFLPIVAYGDPVLNKVAEEIDEQYPGLEALIANMYETMYGAHGVGLAAPQIGRSIRLFIVDASPFAEEGEEDYEFLKDFKKTFINPIIIEESGEEWGMEEGCLSIPGVYLNVVRPSTIKLRFRDEMGRPRKMKADGLLARCIQHEMDHLNGVLFVDRVTSKEDLNKELIKEGFHQKDVIPIN